MPFSTSGYVASAARWDQYSWDNQEMLQHRGYIYTAKHEGWYSVSDETFYPQSQVHLSLDPATGRKRMVWPPTLYHENKLTVSGFYRNREGSRVVL